MLKFGRFILLLFIPEISMSYFSFIFRYPHSSPSIIFDVYSGPSWLGVWRNCLVGVSRSILSPPFEVIIAKKRGAYGRSIERITGNKEATPRCGS